MIAACFNPQKFVLVLICGILGLTIFYINKTAFATKIPLSITPSIQNADWVKAWWVERHQDKIDERRSMHNQVDLVFLGDSIMHSWEDLGESEWRQYYQPRNALNLGFSGDRTENVLWRIANGAVDDINPKLVVLMIGTNNAGHRKEDPTETALGIEKIIEALHSKLPDTKILLLAIFPRGKSSQDPMRLLVDSTNRLIQPMADNKTIFWLNVNDHFLQLDGAISQSVMSDYLHPNASQYKVWALAMEPTIVELMNQQ